MNDVTHAVRFNNVFALMLGITMIVVPIKIACSIAFKMSQAHSTLVEQLEGGEKEENKRIEESSYPHRVEEESKNPNLVEESKNPNLVEESKNPSLVEESKNPNLVEESKYPHRVDESKSMDQEDMPTSSQIDIEEVIEEKAKFKHYLKEIEEYEKNDAEVKAEHGAFVSTLTHRLRLSPTKHAWLVLWSFAHRILIALVIIGLYSYPSMQVTLSLVLTLFNTSILLSVRPHGVGPEQRS